MDMLLPPQLRGRIRTPTALHARLSAARHRSRVEVHGATHEVSSARRCWTDDRLSRPPQTRRGGSTFSLNCLRFANPHQPILKQPL